MNEQALFFILLWYVRKSKAGGVQSRELDSWPKPTKLGGVEGHAIKESSLWETELMMMYSVPFQQLV